MRAAHARLGTPSSNDDSRGRGSSAWNTSMNGGPCGRRVVVKRDVTAQAWSARDTRTDDGLTLVVRGLGRRLRTGSTR